ncbi:MAG: glycosyltransferase family 2 protein [Prolixibacteraceae bacterium]|nr:glycosyltransferase family 2 protein [Prolixibacteraceae bacterium]
MPFANKYIERNRGMFSVFPPQLPAMDVIVVIPCYNEPELGTTLESLADCNNPGINVGVVVVVNSPVGTGPDIEEQNSISLAEIAGYNKMLPPWLRFFSIDAQGLPAKHAGAGWARKIGMDWATGHFNNTGNPGGLIASLDADTLVEPGYLTAIRDAFNNKPSAIAATIYFEHPIEEEQANRGIACYELYMRYYRHALAFAGFPHALYTLGSCFVVKAAAYVAQGGMNRRKAGEDFYFLHKLVPYGQIIEINNTTVYPSARISNRVPFGTGPALIKMMQGEVSHFKTYPLEAFMILKHFFCRLKVFFEKQEHLTVEDLSPNPVFHDFSAEQNLVAELIELGKNCSNPEIFSQRFFHVFNAFRVLKWLNFAVKNGYPKKNLLTEGILLLEKKGHKASHNPNITELLYQFRKIDKNR